MLYSFDGGQSGNLFAGHYFDLNKKHLDGSLQEAVIGRAAVELKSHTRLVIKPASKVSESGINIDKSDQKTQNSEF